MKRLIFKTLQILFTRTSLLIFFHITFFYIYITLNTSNVQPLIKFLTHSMLPDFEMHRKVNLTFLFKKVFE